MNSAVISKSHLYEGMLSFLMAVYVLTLATSMSGMELFAALLIVAVLVGAVIGKVQLVWPPFAAPILAFIVVAWAGTLLAEEPWNQTIYDMQRMRFFFIYFFLFIALRSSKGFPWEKYLAGIAFVIAIYGTLQHFFPLDLVRPEGRKIILYSIAAQKIGPLVLGTFNHHLTFVNIYLFYACLFTALGLSKIRWSPFFLALGLWLFLLCFWTQSRTGWIAIGVTGALLGLSKSKKAFLGVVVGFGVVVGVLYATDLGFRERFDRTVGGHDSHYSPQDRVRLWHANWEMFKTSPLVGIGYNNGERRAKEFVDRLYPTTQNFYGHAHSTFSQLLSNTGLLGVCVYLWLWYLIFRKTAVWIRGATSQKEHWMAIGLGVGFIGFHIQGLTQWNFGDAEVLHNLMFFWAVVASAVPSLSVPKQER
jgi:putative inorganic carbon (hco3(-)) transporter